ncbi:AzlD domain-containing protein [Scleromatobacter humisilvae]|uniref:AzlD domain-containing protein n=1 Tax=Scleromatobacter humisilvae TaxID=2897159 RepID=A0A9X1YJG3_9BURK|nr:AzlD domain-containing protein [Scleromatobacter humisilvae]MCK9685507.1 AzlD domain-containing protein [Scleromatobacter humisilvae]
MTTWMTLAAIAGLTVVSVVTRGFFMIPNREVPIPAWLREALRYAPLAALVAVLLPEIAMTGDHLISTWKDARIYATATGILVFCTTRSLLGTILAGTATLLALRLTLGW